MNKRLILTIFVFLLTSACSLDNPDAPKQKKAEENTTEKSKPADSASPSSPKPTSEAATAKTEFADVKTEDKLSPKSMPVPTLPLLDDKTMVMPLPLPATPIPFFYQLVVDDNTVAVAAYLKAKKVDPFTEQDASGRLPIHYARSQKMLELLWDLPKAQEVIDSNGELAIHVMARDGHASAIKFVVNEWCGFFQRKKLNTRDQAGRTMLHLAVENGSVETVKTLLSCSYINITAVDQMKQSALHYAVMHEDFNIGYLLLLKAHKQLLPLKDDQDNTALESARAMGNLNAVKIMEILK